MKRPSLFCEGPGSRSLDWLGGCGAQRSQLGSRAELGCKGSGVSAAGGGWDCLGHSEPLSDALVVSQGLEFWKRVEDGSSLSPQGN